MSLLHEYHQQGVYARLMSPNTQVVLPSLDRNPTLSPLTRAILQALSLSLMESMEAISDDTTSQDRSFTEKKSTDKTHDLTDYARANGFRKNVSTPSTVDSLSRQNSDDLRLESKQFTENDPIADFSQATSGRPSEFYSRARGLSSSSKTYLGSSRDISGEGDKRGDKSAEIQRHQNEKEYNLDYPTEPRAEAVTKTDSKGSTGHSISGRTTENNIYHPVSSGNSIGSGHNSPIKSANLKPDDLMYPPERLLDPRSPSRASPSPQTSQDTPVEPLKVRRQFKHLALPPSHSDFDRSALSDLEYIELLLFENKELLATILQQKTEIEALKAKIQGHAPESKDPVLVSPIVSPASIEVPTRSARRRPNEKKDVQDPLVSPLEQTHRGARMKHEQSSSSIQRDDAQGDVKTLERTPSLHESTTPRSADRIKLPDPSLPIPDGGTTNDGSVPDGSSVLGGVILDSSVLSSSQGMARSSQAGDGFLSDNLTSSTSEDKGLQSAAQVQREPILRKSSKGLPRSVASDHLATQAASSRARTDSANVRSRTLSFGQGDHSFNDTMDSVDHSMSAEPTNLERVTSVQSSTSNEVRAVRSQENKVGILNKNASNSSFSSYKLRIKLPHTMSQQTVNQDKDANSHAQTPHHKGNVPTALHPNDPFNEEGLLRSPTQSYSTPPTQITPSFTDQRKLAASESGDPLFVDDLHTPLSNTFPSNDSVKGQQSASSSYRVLSTPNIEDDDLLFIKPEDFNTIEILVSSTIHVSHNQLRRQDDPNFTLAIADRALSKELWRIRKTYGQFAAFDSEIRQVIEYFGLPPMPDRQLFFLTAPNKIETRRCALQNYFNSIFLMPHVPRMILYKICKFLSLDFVNPMDDYRLGAAKEGYLVRRYKALGTSWKVRWCQVDGPYLEVYENPGGPLLELIMLEGAQIGRQLSDAVAEDRGYRHAFLIVEMLKQSKLSSLYPKHFFCAETDEERDDWVNILLSHDQHEETRENHEDIDGQNSIHESSNNAQREQANPQDAHANNSHQQSHHPLHSNSQPPQGTAEEPKKTKKRSLFPFRNNRPVEEEKPETPKNSMQQYLDQMNLDEGMAKLIFGRELAEAFALSSHRFQNTRELPSIFFRCIDYLMRTGAIYEEGIFRLSGSALTIRALKEEFNTHFDVDLFELPLRPDIHTVAGLFKTYLRELPSPLLGTHAYNHLNQVMLQNTSLSPSVLATVFRDYISEQVDDIHYDSCYVLFRFLREVIAHQSNNRMNLRNVCIVFVPTLNILLEVLTTLLVDFECIFEGGAPVGDNEREVLDLKIPNF